MDFELSDEQVALQGELRRFLADRMTPEARRAVIDMPGAVDRDLWRDLGGMGVFALTLPEAQGGVGLGLADATIVCEELGRACVPGPLLGTFFAAGLRADGTDPEVLDLARRAAAGEAVVGLVPAGDPAFVEHLAGLDALLVVGDDEVRLLDPPADSRPVDRPLDPLTPVDVVDALPPGRVVGGPEVAAVLRNAATLLSAALQVGLAEAAVALGTGYAKERRQFGKVIGTFQAVKHLLADAQVQVEVARAAVQAAGVEIDDALAGVGDGPRLHRTLDGARIVASRAADRATRACIQVHGGMGFTWELDAHLFLKRALVLDVGLGSPDAAAASLSAAL
ncbi:MAG TPA: acyl-CoA dehydrogenase family protein [Acidimicrobiales bacterium]|nr:acyl-CoA dehydrogenase family protein [Acidimicrobiales bacterium]